MGIPRTRTLGGFTNQVGYVFGGPPGTPWSVVYPSTPVGWRKITSDHVNPGFHQASRKGQIVSSPFDSLEESFSGPMVDSLWQGPYTGPWEEGGVRPYAAFPSYPSVPGLLYDSLAEAAAINQANAGVSPNYASVAVTVAELDKTLQMFRAAGNTAKDFANVMIVASRSLRGKKNSARNQKKAMQDVANLWLQARYGWLPVIYDIQGMVKSFTKERNQRETSRGHASKQSSDSGQVIGSWRGTYGYSYTLSRVVEYRSGIMYENLKDLGAEYTSRLGLSAADALTVPWELVPFSFVVDWFIDIGDYLRAISPKPGVRNLAAWTTCRSESILTLSSPFVNCTESGWTASASGGNFEIKTVRKTRSLSAVPTIPGYGSGLNVNRSIDSAALAFQQLKGLLSYSSR